MVDALIDSVKYHLTPASYGVCQQIDGAIREISIQLMCIERGCTEKSGLFKGIAWSVIGRKENGNASIHVRCSDPDIESDYEGN